MSGYTEIALLQYEIEKLRAERSALRAELREICAAIDDPACDLTHTAAECIKKIKAEQRVAEYNELIYAVQTKHPDETRHQTALRYIRNAENRQSYTAANGASS